MAKKKHGKKKVANAAEVAKAVRRLNDQQALAFIMQRYECSIEAAEYILHNNRFIDAMARGEIVSPRILPDGTIIMI